MAIGKNAAAVHASKTRALLRNTETPFAIRRNALPAVEEDPSQLSVRLQVPQRHQLPVPCDGRGKITRSTSALAVLKRGLEMGSSAAGGDSLDYVVHAGKAGPRHWSNGAAGE